MKTLYLTLIVAALTTGITAAQSIPITPEQWIFTGNNISINEFKGLKCIHFSGKGGREAYLKDCKFVDGEITFKVAGQMFVGLIFRVQDAKTYEGFYFRPENSAHEDPVKRGHTVQYIAHPKFTWSFLRKEYPEKYEAAAKIPVNDWFDVRVLVKGTRAEVYVNRETSPCLVVEDLKHGNSVGSVGFYVDSGKEGWFADLSIASTASGHSPSSEPNRAVQPTPLRGAADR